MQACSGEVAGSCRWEGGTCPREGGRRTAVRWVEAPVVALMGVGHSRTTRT